MDSMSDLQVSSLQEAKKAVSVASNGSQEAELVKRMTRLRQNPINFAHELWLFVRGVEWRGYNKQLGQPCFYPGYSDHIKYATLASPLLHQKIEDLTEARITVEVEQQLLDNKSPRFAVDKAKRRAEIMENLEQITGEMLDKMMCKMESNTFIRAGFYGATQLLTRAYSGIHVSQDEVNRLLEVASEAAAKKIPIVFLPRHTSHVDYVTLQLVCYRLNMTLPVVVAGDNLNFPLVGAFLQSAGAMWIRRSFDNDQLYTALFQSYLDTLLQQGYNTECFIEGGRSRTGKLLGPKFGFLSFLLDSVLSGRTQDAYICPVSTQYDKVLEVDSYVSELLGKPKKKENLADFLSSSSVLSLNFGRIDCRFREPWSLREFIDQQTARFSRASDSVNIGRATRQLDLRTRLLRTLGYRVLSDINSVSVVMPTALVGTVLLTLRGRGVGKTELARRVDWLCKRIKANGGNVADFHGMPTDFVVDRALEVLGPTLVGTVEGLVEPTYHAADRFQLSFYRNMTIHLFISEALIAAALYTRVKQGGGSASEQISETELTEKVAFLSQLFRGEFIFPAGQGLQHNLEDAVKSLVGDEVLDYAPKDSAPDGADARIGLSPKERREGRENFDFYCFLIWPFCDAIWLGAVSLLCLVPPADSTAVSVPMNRAQEVAQLMGRTLYHQGDLSYFEAINKEALKNGYTRFQEEGIILVIKNKDKKIPVMVRLAPEWLPTRSQATGDVEQTGRLWEFIERVSAFRREGKNRRDGATSGKRVMNLVATLNEALFTQTTVEAVKDDQSAASGPDDSAESVTLKKTRRRSRL